MSGTTPLGFSIPIVQQQQHHENACWATCLAMIFKWAGVAVTKEEIFNAGPRLLSDYSYGEVASLAEANKVGVKLSNGSVSFKRLDLAKVQKSKADDWIRYINVFRPVLFSLGNHCRILMGYQPVEANGLLYLDPGDDAGSPPRPLGIGQFTSKVADAWALDKGRVLPGGLHPDFNAGFFAKADAALPLQ